MNTCRVILASATVALVLGEDGLVREILLTLDFPTCIPPAYAVSRSRPRTVPVPRLLPQNRMGLGSTGKRERMNGS
jgi:hypothetical protein